MHDSLLRQRSALLLHIKFGHPQSPQHLQTASVRAVGGQRKLHLQQTLQEQVNGLRLKGFHNVMSHASERESHWPWAQHLWQRSTRTVKPPAERQSQAVRRAHIPSALQRWHTEPSDNLMPAPTTHTHTHSITTLFKHCVCLSADLDASIYLKARGGRSDHFGQEQQHTDSGQQLWAVLDKQKKILIINYRVSVIQTWIESL